MNVFLVYVRDAAYFHLLPEASRGDDGRVRVMAFPPLGIQTLAPVLRKGGHQVRMFDTCHPQMRAEDIAEAARRDRPDVIGLSFLSVTAYPAMKALARVVKEANPEIPIIAGGAFASINSERMLSDCPHLDHVGVGEGEELLLDHLAHLGEPEAVAGLTWRRNGGVVKNEPRPLIRDLDRYPYPDRTGLPIEYIESLPLDVPAVLSLDRFCTMQTSRGCPYSCVYCDIPSLMQGKWRSRSAAHVLGELQELSDQGYRSVYFTDDHFLLKRRRTSEICEGIIERGLRLRWGCEGRVDSVRDEELALMGKAHCAMLAYGVESGSQRTLDRLGKRQTLAQVEHAVRQARKNGIERVHGFFVIGCPGETAADVRQTFRFAARLELDTFGFNRLAVYRGTPLWNEYVERQIIDEDRDWDKTFKCCDIDPDALPSSEVNRLRMRGYLALLLRRIVLHPLRTWELLRTFSRHMALGDLLRLVSGPFRAKAASAPALPARMVDAGTLARPREAKAPEPVGQRSMRLLLINPCNPLVSIVHVEESRWNRYRIWKPLSLMVLAGLTPKEWEVSIVDENLGAPDYPSMPRPDLVGITAFTSQANRAYEVADQFRSLGVPVVMGGIHATMCLEEATAHVDAVVTGEAEGIWSKVLEDFQHGRLERRYDGGLAEIDDVRPARHDLTAEGYAFGAVQTTRGCPLNCSFCSVTAFNGARYRQRPIADVVREFGMIRERHVLVVDDNLIGTRPEHIARAKNLFRALAQADLRKEWVGQATINFADDEELLTLASRAGCRGVFIGFESPTVEGLREIGKRFNVQKDRDFRASVRRIQRHGIMVVGSFIIGLDVDEPGIGHRIAEAASQYGVDNLNALFLTPLPGTRLWERMKADGRIALDRFPEDWNYFTLTFPVGRYRHLSMNGIIGEMLACHRAFYALPRILRRTWDSLWRRRAPLISLVASLSYRSNFHRDCRAYADFQRKLERRALPVERVSTSTSRRSGDRVARTLHCR